MRRGIASTDPPDLLRHTLVVQVCPSTVATTGVRPHGWVALGACRAGISAKYQALLPLYRNSRAVKDLEMGLFQTARAGLFAGQHGLIPVGVSVRDGAEQPV